MLKNNQPTTKEELLNKLNELETKANHYSRTDWDAYNRVMEQIKNLDSILLEIYNTENEVYLASIEA